VLSAGPRLARVTLVVFLSPGIISTFLHVHPFGASIEYICSYLQRLDSKVGVPARPGSGVCAAGKEPRSLPRKGDGRDRRIRRVLTGMTSWERERVSCLRTAERSGLGGASEGHLVRPAALRRGTVP